MALRFGEPETLFLEKSAESFNIAPHGAGLRNLHFSERCQVLELHPVNLIKTLYFLLCKGLGFDYNYTPVIGMAGDRLDNFTIAEKWLWRLTKKQSFTIYVSVGGYGGVLLNGKHTSETENFYETPRHYSSESEIGVNDRYKFDRFDFGANLGCGIEFGFLKSELVLDGTYAFGLSNVQEAYKSAIPRWGSDHFYWENGTVGANGKNRFFALSLGYVLTFNRRGKIHYVC